MKDLFYKLPQSIAARRDLLASDKLVYAVVNDCFNGKDICWPGKLYLMERTGLSGQVVLDAIARLEKADVLVVERRGNGRSNHYKSGQENRPVKKLDRSKNNTTGGQEIRPEAVRKLDPNQTDQLNQKARAAKIVFDADAENFIGITSADLTRWGAAFPGVNLQAEILQAANWLVSKNQTRDDYRRYLLNWLKRSKPTAAEPTGDYIEDADQIEQIYKEAGLC